MASLSSVADIMELSQLAWKIGCTFTSGRPGAPAEFREIENELTSLTKAITLLAEVLDKDDSILARADEKTKDGLDKILECCRQTLENLNALVDQYQDVIRPDGNGSIAVQRIWRPIFVRNYKKIWWTSEGGDIQVLRDTLQMHVRSISLIMQALQSKSLTRLENTVEPMADKVTSIRKKFNGDLDAKITEIHDLMETMSGIGDSSKTWPMDNNGSASPKEVKKQASNPDPVSIYNLRRVNTDKYQYPLTPGRTPELAGREISAPQPRETPGNGVEEGRAPDRVERPPRVRSTDEPPPVYDYKWRKSVANHAGQAAELIQTARPSNLDTSIEPAIDILSPATSQASPVSSGIFPSNSTYFPSVPSVVMPPSASSNTTSVVSAAVSPQETPQIPPRSPLRLTPSRVSHASSTTSNETSYSSILYEASERSHGPSRPNTSQVQSDQTLRVSESSSFSVRARPSFELSLGLPVMLPSPLIPPTQDAQPLHLNSSITSFMPAYDSTDLPSMQALATEAEQALFESELTRDSATLCEANGTLVEYTAPDEDNPGEWKMTEAAPSCKISIITRMQKYTTGSHFITSIWIMSDDRKIRLQQKLPDGSQIIPYTIWGNNLKVVLRVGAELKFHDIVHNSRPLNIVKTQWVNYVFADETGSALFQSVLMGQSLILSLKTKRTLRVHDGLGGAFAFQEQLCGLENIRLWRLDSGDVLAMVHYSPHFRDGYLAFNVGFTSRKRIHFRGDGERHVKIKGLEVSIDEKKKESPVGEDKPAKSKAEKKITAIRIEFISEEDKRMFLNKLKEVQG